MIGHSEVAKFEHAVWSRSARRYKQGFEVLSREAVPPLLDTVDLRQGERVLDLGTSPGTAAAARGAIPIGVDFSETMVAEARRGNPEIEFRTADVHSLPFKDDEFDVAIANLLLHHLGDPDRALREVQRVLQPGGRFAFTIWADIPKLEAFGLFFGCDPARTTALIPRIAESRFESDDTSSRCYGESCFTLRPSAREHQKISLNTSPLESMLL